LSIGTCKPSSQALTDVVVVAVAGRPGAPTKEDIISEAIEEQLLEDLESRPVENIEFELGDNVVYTGPARS
jgi:hypothetical protein